MSMKITGLLNNSTLISNNALLANNNLDYNKININLNWNQVLNIKY